MKSRGILPALLLPLLPLCLWCGNGDDSPPGSDLVVEDGPGADGGVLVDATPGPDPFGDAAADSGDTPDAQTPCDDDQGDDSACDNPGAETCLTPAICNSLSQYLSARSAGLAMDCVAGFTEDCPPEVLANCFVTGATLACAPAAAGAAPCDTLATLCASGDPWGLVEQCLDMAAGLTPGGASALGTCLQNSGLCAPETFSACTTDLFFP